MTDGSGEQVARRDAGGIVIANRARCLLIKSGGIGLQQGR
jgi:hypothetical protein